MAALIDAIEVKRMKSRQVLRIWLWTVALIAAVALTIAAYIPIQQQVLRYRAKRLLADIREIELQKSTWSDAQALMMRWGEWGRYEGTCTSAACSYQVDLSDSALTLITKHPKTAESWQRRPRLRRLYDLLGGRLVSIKAQITVIDGRVWMKSYQLAIDVPPGGRQEPGAADAGYSLLAVARTVPKFEQQQRHQLLLHSEYMIRTPVCHGCSVISAEFSPYADKSDVERLMDFNLACITRRQPCRNGGDIMPGVWKQYERESHHS